MALNEGMALPVLQCRDMFDPKPHMIPGRVKIWMQAATSKPERAACYECGPTSVDVSALVGSPALILDVDLARCTPKEMFEAPAMRLSVHCDRPSDVTSKIRGLVGWFDLVCCDAHAETVLETGPHAPGTHWEQMWLPFEDPIALPVDFDIRLRISNRRTATCVLPELAVDVCESNT